MENNEQATPQPEAVVEDTGTESEETSQEESNDEVAELRRQLEEQNEKISDLTGKLKRASKPKETSKKESKATDERGFDYGELAFHNSKTDSFKLEHTDDIQALQTAMQDTGKSMSEILESKWFQEDIGKMQDKRNAAQALPKETKRGASPAADEATYWFNKVQQGTATLNDIPDVNVRRQVLNRRIEQEKGPQFSSTPTLGA